MSEDRRPSIKKWTGYKTGKCHVCGKTAERQQPFTGDDAYEQMLAWDKEPIEHKRCERADR